MEGKIVNFKSFKAVGVTYFGSNEKGEIPALWEVFNKRYGEIKHKNNTVLCYGICDDDIDPQGQFHYTACTEVESFQDVPQGMTTKVVQEGKYIVYTYSGAIKDLGEFYNKIFTSWLPEADCEMDCRPQLELYDGRFSDNGEFDIYIPVK